MKGYRFYADFCAPTRYPNMWNGELGKRQSRRINRSELRQMADDGWRCNCIALRLIDPVIEDDMLLYGIAMAECYSADAACSWGRMMQGYLKRNGKRISERLARRLHPALFEFLETSGAL